MLYTTFFFKYCCDLLIILQGVPWFSEHCVLSIHSKPFLMHPVVWEEWTLYLPMTASFEGQKLCAEKISPSVQLHKLPSLSVYVLQLRGYFIGTRKASVRLQCNSAWMYLSNTYACTVSRLLRPRLRTPQLCRSLLSPALKAVLVDLFKLKDTRPVFKTV